MLSINKKITQQAYNTRDPAARPVVFQFQRRSSTARCAGVVARLAHAYAFIKHMTNIVDIFFLSEIGYFFGEYKNWGLLAFLSPAGLQIFQDEEG